MHRSGRSSDDVSASPSSSSGPLNSHLLHQGRYHCDTPDLAESRTTTTYLGVKIPNIDTISHTVGSLFARRIALSPETHELLPLHQPLADQGHHHHPWRTARGTMKFGTLLELNSNIEWWEKYVDYDGLKKLFPAEPFEPSYHRASGTHDDPEGSPLLGGENGGGVSQDEFSAACDRERNKVVDFYAEKERELDEDFERLQKEIQILEQRELEEIGPIAEVDEETDEEDDARRHNDSSDDSDHEGQAGAGQRPRTLGRHPSLISRLRRGIGSLGQNEESRDEADLLEAALAPAIQQSQQNSRKRSRSRNNNQDESLLGKSPARRSHRLSVSSTGSSAGVSRRGRRHLGLVPMNHESGEGDAYIWTANTDYGKVLRIGFKKRIATLWLDANSLKQYVDLNLTAFEKILKKFDKNTHSSLKKRYIDEKVLQSQPWKADTKARLDDTMQRILMLYARVAAGGDVELAKQQLRAQLREKIVVDRETVWGKMVEQRRKGDSNLKVVALTEKGYNTIRTPIGSLHFPAWLSIKAIIFLFACVTLVTIIRIQPFEQVAESNCLAMLAFCTILWATEAIPLFVTSFSVPLLTVTLRLIRDGDEQRLSAADATKYIFSQMFSPTIMLLIGGFTIAAVLSKTRLDVMAASRVLNAAGSNPSIVLLCLMLVATFASMWISNVASPTLCYALIRPIIDELSPKSAFSRCLIIAIALASNIGGQASPISSPQNLIALSAMERPLSWLQWFAIALPVASISILAIWAFLHLGYRWESDLEIPRMRKNSDPLTATHYYVLIVSLITIGLWCAEKSLEAWVGDMGVIAIIPVIAFFGTGILSKDDFHHFHWSIVFLAMGGIALGKSVLSSGLLDDLDRVLESTVDGLGLYKILLIFSVIALIIATL